MLVNLKIRDIRPDMICAMISKINGVDLETGDYFEQYTTGVYRHDGYKFNFDSFIKNNTNDKIIDSWVNYGVCDNHEQILNRFKDLLADSSKKYVIGLSTVERKNQSPDGGWRWHKWGEYIGTQNPKNEYLYDDTHIDKVYCYHIYEVA